MPNGQLIVPAALLTIRMIGQRKITSLTIYWNCYYQSLQWVWKPWKLLRSCRL